MKKNNSLGNKLTEKVPIKHFLLIMRTIFILLFTCLFCSMAEVGYTQNARVTINKRNVTLKEVLNEIESQTDYLFIYNDEVNTNEKVSVKSKQQAVANVLNKLLEDKDVVYSMEGNHIILSAIEKASLPEKETADAIAQQQKKAITGTVVDAAGVPIVGANIIEAGTTNGTVTDVDGKFSLSVENNATIHVSYIGYLAQVMSTTGKTSFNITLVEDTKALEEVVVVGYGTQKKVNLTGSVATISSTELTVAPVASTTNALAGRLPGLITKQDRGLPGSDASTLSIRGFGSPLIIVDGIETSFNNIDASEIESISILKDASAAIYGSRAGNGVFLITTKRGTMGKPKFTLNSNYTIQGPTYLPKLSNSGQQTELEREAHLNSGQPEATAPWTQEEVDLFYAGTDPDFPNEDWYSLAARDWAPQHQHNLSVRGGSEKIKYFGFLGYLDQQSIFKNNGGEYQRYNVRSNIDAQITNKLNVQFDLSTIVEDRDFPWRGDESANSVWDEYWGSRPYFAGKLPDKNKIAYAGLGGAVSLPAITNSKISGYRRTNSQNIKGSLTFDYKFNLDGLSAKAFINYDRNYSFFKMWDWLVDSYSYNYSNDTYTQYTTKSNRGLTYRDSKNRSVTGQASLHYDNVFSADHHVTALALFEIIDYNSNWIQAFRDGQKTFLLDYAFAGSLANQKLDDGASEMGRISYVGRVNYAYKSKYLLESTIRIDQSAKFRSDQRTGIFPSISMGWRLSEEGFVKENIPLIENFKLRVSFSQMGNDAVGNFQYLSGYRYGETYLIGSNATTGLVARGLANPFLTWEEMNIYNMGLDFGLKKRILYGEFDIFYRERNGIPGTRSVSLPTTFGASLPTENLNSVNTRGFELKLGNEGRVYDFSWDVSANLSWARSKWGFYDEPEYKDPDEIRLYKRTGKWIDINYGYLSDGIFTSQQEIDDLDFVYNETQGNVALKPGDIRYKDTNNDGLLNWRDQVEIGKGTMPHWMLGINMNLNYKNFNLQALFQGAFGFTQKIVLIPGAVYSELVYNERWTPENNNRDGLIPRLGGANTNNYNSDFNYKKSDYIRLKDLSLGYSLPKSFIQKAGIENLRLYLAGTNLFTISGLNKYIIDPEGQSGNSGKYYPQMCTISIGLNLSF